MHVDNKLHHPAAIKSGNAVRIDPLIQLGGVPVVRHAPPSAPGGLTLFDATTVIRINLNAFDQMHSDVLGQIAVLRELLELAQKSDFLYAQEQLANAAKSEADRIRKDVNKLRSQMSHVSGDLAPAIQQGIVVLEERVRAVSNQLACAWSAAYQTPYLAGLSQEFYRLKKIVEPRSLAKYAAEISPSEQVAPTVEIMSPNPTTSKPAAPTFLAVVTRGAHPSQAPQALQPPAPTESTKKVASPMASQPPPSPKTPTPIRRKPVSEVRNKKDEGSWATVGTKHKPNKKSGSNEPRPTPASTSTTVSPPPIVTPDLPEKPEPAVAVTVSQSEAAKQTKSKKTKKDRAAIVPNAKAASKKETDEEILAAASKQANEEREAAAKQLEAARVQRRQEAAPLVTQCRAIAEELFALRLAMVAGDNNPMILMSLARQVQEALDGQQSAICKLERLIMKDYPQPIKDKKSDNQRQRATQKIEQKMTQDDKDVPAFSRSAEEVKTYLKRLAEMERDSANRYVEQFVAGNFGNEITAAMLQWTQATRLFGELFLSL